MNKFEIKFSKRFIISVSLLLSLLVFELVKSVTLKNNFGDHFNRIQESCLMSSNPKFSETQNKSICECFAVKVFKNAVTAKASLMATEENLTERFLEDCSKNSVSNQVSPRVRTQSKFVIGI